MALSESLLEASRADAFESLRFQLSGLASEGGPLSRSGILNLAPPGASGDVRQALVDLAESIGGQFKDRAAFRRKYDWLTKRSGSVISRAAKHAGLGEIDYRIAFDGLDPIKVGFDWDVSMGQSKPYVSINPFFEEILDSRISGDMSSVLLHRMKTSGVSSHIIDTLSANKAKAKDFLPFLVSHELGHIEDIKARGVEGLYRDATKIFDDLSGHRRRALSHAGKNLRLRTMSIERRYSEASHEAFADRFAARMLNEIPDIDSSVSTILQGGIASASRTISSVKHTLPELKPGYVRLLHSAKEHHLFDIIDVGQPWSPYDSLGIYSVARVHRSTEAASEDIVNWSRNDYSADQRWRGKPVAVWDVPEDVFNKYASGAAGNMIEAKYLVGIVDPLEEEAKRLAARSVGAVDNVILDTVSKKLKSGISSTKKVATVAGTRIREGVRRIPKLKALGVIAGLGLTIAGAAQRHKQGESMPSVVAKAAGEEALYTLVPWAAATNIAFQGTRALLSGFVNVSQKLMSVSSVYRTGFGGFYRDSLPAATMRQAGMKAIEDQQLAARNVMGQEARLMSR
jgi:hypothetical protein